MEYYIRTYYRQFTESHLLGTYLLIYYFMLKFSVIQIDLNKKIVLFIFL